MTLQWEVLELVDQLTSNSPKLGNWLKTERSPIAGGWLVRTIFIQREAAQVPGSVIEPEINSSVSLTFVPDPGWSWKK